MKKDWRGALIADIPGRVGKKSVYGVLDEMNGYLDSVRNRADALFEEVDAEDESYTVIIEGSRLQAAQELITSISQLQIRAIWIYQQLALLQSKGWEVEKGQGDDSGL